MSPLEYLKELERARLPLTVTEPPAIRLILMLRAALLMPASALQERSLGFVQQWSPMSPQPDGACSASSKTMSASAQPAERLVDTPLSPGSRRRGSLDQMEAPGEAHAGRNEQW